MTVRENMSISVLDEFGSPFWLSHRKEKKFVADWMGKLDVVAGGGDSPVQTLSGGNQQKVLFGRVLAREPRVLVLCEPTAGVDIGARHAIYELVAEQVRRGLERARRLLGRRAICSRCAPECSSCRTGSSPASCKGLGSPSTSSCTPWRDWRANRHDHHHRTWFGRDARAR